MHKGLGQTGYAPRLGKTKPIPCGWARARRIAPVSAARPERVKQSQLAGNGRAKQSQSVAGELPVGISQYSHYSSIPVFHYSSIPIRCRSCETNPILAGPAGSWGAIVQNKPNSHGPGYPTAPLYCSIPSFHSLLVLRNKANFVSAAVCRPDPLGGQAGCSWHVARDPVHSVSASHQDGLN